MATNKIPWKRYFVEFLSIFIGVTMAFALNKWNEDRRDYRSENKTLTEIRNGLELDLKDLQENIYGHETGITACDYYRQLLNNDEVNRDSIFFFYFYLTRDFISIQNKSGYEALKSKGLELIRNDSIRLKIIRLYDFSYEIIEKLEEEYSENQFHEIYFHPINDAFAKYYLYDDEGRLVSIRNNIQVDSETKQKILSFLVRIYQNRGTMLMYYRQVEEDVQELIEIIGEELGE